MKIFTIEVDDQGSPKFEKFAANVKKSLKEATDGTKQTNKSLDDLSKNIKNAFNGLEKSLSTNFKAIAKNQAAVIAQSSKVTEAVRKSADAVKPFGKAISDLTKENARLNKSLDDVNKKVGILSKSAAQWRSANTNLHGSITNLQRQVNQLNRQMTVLQGQNNRLSSGLNNVNNRLRTGSGHWKSYGNNMGYFNRAMTTGTTAVTRFTSALSGLRGFAGAALLGLGFRAVTQEVREFDASIRQAFSFIGSQSVKEAFGQTASGVRQSLYNLSGGSGSHTEFAQSLQLAIGSGVDPSQSLAFLEQAKTLAIGGRGEIQETVDLLTTIRNAFGGEYRTEAGLNKAMNILFSTMDKGKITLTEISKNFSTVAGIAGELEIPLEQVGAAIATLTSKGHSAPKAFVELNAILDATLKQADKWWTEFNVDIVRVAREGGLTAVFEEVEKAAGKNLHVVRQLFPEIRAQRGVYAAMAREMSEYTRALNSITDAESAMRARKLQEGGYDYQLKELGNLSKSLLSQVGDSVLSILQPTINQISNSLLNAVAEDKLKNIGMEIGKVFKDVFDLVFSARHEIVELIGYMVQFAKAVTDAAKLIKDLFIGVNDLAGAFISLEFSAKSFIAIWYGSKLLKYFADLEVAIKGTVAVASSLATVPPSLPGWLASGNTVGLTFAEGFKLAFLNVLANPVTGIIVGLGIILNEGAKLYSHRAGQAIAEIANRDYTKDAQRGMMFRKQYGIQGNAGNLLGDTKYSGGLMDTLAMLDRDGFGKASTSLINNTNLIKELEGTVEFDENLKQHYLLMENQARLYASDIESIFKQTSDLAKKYDIEIKSGAQFASLADQDLNPLNIHGPSKRIIGPSGIQETLEEKAARTEAEKLLKITRVLVERSLVQLGTIDPFKDSFSAYLERNDDGKKPTDSQARSFYSLFQPIGSKYNQLNDFQKDEYIKYSKSFDRKHPDPAGFQAQQFALSDQLSGRNTFADINPYRDVLFKMESEAADSGAELEEHTQILLDILKTGDASLAIYESQLKRQKESASVGLSLGESIIGGIGGLFSGGGGIGSLIKGIIPQLGGVLSGFQSGELDATSFFRGIFGDPGGVGPPLPFGDLFKNFALDKIIPSISGIIPNLFGGGEFSKITSSLGSLGGSALFEKVFSGLDKAAGPLGALAGSFLGPILSGLKNLVFGKSNKERFMDFGKSSGVQLGEEDYQTLYQRSYKQFGVANKGLHKKDFISLGLDLIIEKMTITKDNIAKVSSDFLKLFTDIAKGGGDSSIKVEVLNDSFASLIPKIEEAGLASSASFQTLIAAAKASGQEIKAVNEYLRKNLAEGAAGLSKFIQGIQMVSKEGIKIGKEKFTLGGAKFSEKDAGKLTKEQLESISQIAGSMFEALSSAGGASEALLALGDTTKELAEQFKKLNIPLPEFLSHMIQIQNFTNANEGLFMMIDGMKELATNLDEAGALSGDTIRSLTVNLNDMFGSLQRGGMTELDALRELAPILQAIYNQHLRNGTAIDKETQALIDQAKGYDLITDAGTGMITTLQRGFDELLKALGHNPIFNPGKAVDAANRAGGAWTDAINKIKKQGGTLDDFWRDINSGGGGEATPPKGFASGTQYVPNDMLAYVHKGEKIVPAHKSNDDGGGGGSIEITVSGGSIGGETYVRIKDLKLQLQKLINEGQIIVRRKYVV